MRGTLKGDYGGYMGFRFRVPIIMRYPFGGRCNKDSILGSPILGNNLSCCIEFPSAQRFMREWDVSVFQARVHRGQTQMAATVYHLGKLEESGIVWGYRGMLEKTMETTI